MHFKDRDTEQNCSTSKRSQCLARNMRRTTTGKIAVEWLIRWDSLI